MNDDRSTSAPKSLSTNHLSHCCLLLALLLTLSGCASLKGWLGFGGPDMEQSADALAMEAMNAFNVGKYSDAQGKFEQILDRFPFSPQAMLAELKSADCKYYKDDLQEAKALYQQFEEQHPTNEAIPYVMFQIGMCDYREIDSIDRDISGARNAIDSFSRLLRAFPESPYTGEAKARTMAAQEFLVNHEYFVAMYYIRSEKYNQAKTRLNYLLSVYPDSMIAPQSRKLLDAIEAGNPPKAGFARWLPDLSLPDWNLFSSKEN